MSSPPTNPEPGGVDATLAEMHRRLDELQQRLRVAAEQGAATGALPASSPLLDEPADDVAALEPPPLDPIPAAPPAPPPADPQGVIAAAQAEADRIVQDAHQRVAVLRWHIDRLLSIRADLIAQARALIVQYEQAIAAIDSAESEPTDTSTPGSAPDF